jgi:FkbM family methyltransferase
MRDDRPQSSFPPVCLRSVPQKIDMARLRKYASVLVQPAYFAALRRGVVPGVEHTIVIALVRPNTLIDIGANKGQFGAVVRHLYRQAAILAFEPLASERAKLQAAVPGDTSVFPVAIGEERGTSTFYVTDRPDSSSLLAPVTGDGNAHGIELSETIEVQVAHVQDFVDLSKIAHPVLMKVDVQGSELSVFRSLGDDIAYIDYIYCEVSFVQLYVKQPLATEICAYLFGKSFALRGIYNVSSTGRLGPTQADFLFERISHDEGE